MLEHALRQLIAEEVRRVLREERETSATATPEAYVSLAVGARRLGMSPPSLRKLIAAGAPAIGSGRLRRIRVSDVAAWLAGRGEPVGSKTLAEKADALLTRGRLRSVAGGAR